MATPKEQHDARPNVHVRNVGHPNHRTPPADATPAGGIPRLTLEELRAESARVGLPDEVAPEQRPERA